MAHLKKFALKIKRDNLSRHLSGHPHDCMIPPIRDCSSLRLQSLFWEGYTLSSYVLKHYSPTISKHDES